MVIAAPAGFRKGTLVRELAASRDVPFLHCTLPDDPAGPAFARSVYDALLDGHRRRAGLAADRLAERAESAAANAREALRREWAAPRPRHVFALRDVSTVLATPAGADLLQELIGSLPAERLLVVTTRTGLPPALQAIVDEAAGTTIGRAQLALTKDETRDIAHASGLDDLAADAVFDLVQGRPMLSGLLLRSLRHGERIEELTDASHELGEEGLLALTVHRTIARLGDAARNALVVAALLREASHEQLVRVLGDDCDDLVFAHVTGLPFVVSNGDRAVVHPDVAAMLPHRFGGIVRALYERTLNALTGEGAYVEAAQVALARGDVLRAAAIIDAAPAYIAAPVPLAEYERIIDHLDRDLVTQFPNVWIATIPFRSVAVDRATFVREAETVYYCLPGDESSERRASALMILASNYANTGRRSQADKLVDEALHGFAREPSPARASLLNYSAWADGIDGRFARARSLAARASEMSRGRFGADQTLHYIDAHEAAFRGQLNRLIAIIDALLRRGDDLPLHVAYAATNGAYFTWALGDDDNFARYISLLEDVLTPGLERGFVSLIDAARGRRFDMTDAYLWPVMRAMAQLFRLGNASNGVEALDAARQAVIAADERGAPFTQLLAYGALYVLDPAARSRSAERLASIAASVESEEMRAAVGSLLRGEPAGILEPFMSRRVRRERGGPAVPRFMVELLAGRMTQGRNTVRFSDKEFELFALLASARASLSRDRIGEALWDHLDPEEWSNNLKVTLSRVRAKLAMRDAVVVVEGRYRLSPLIEVDLRRAESLVRDCHGSRLDEAKRTDLVALLNAFSAGATARYERFAWAQPLHARIDDLACAAGALLAADALERERWDDALRFANDVAAIDPFNEAACETAIRVLLTRGEVDAARREFRRYATSLRDELGAAPSAHLAELVRRHTP